MARKKKMSFKLNPEWMLKEPLDFEYNKYTLLDYIQKCEKSLDRFEIYPDFIELSLHLANMQSLTKEHTLLLTNKKFESCDDEIMLKDLYPKKPRQLSEEEENELTKTIQYSNNKLYDTFNFAKSIWNLAFDSVEISLKKNKVFVWEYQIKRDRKQPNSNKTTLNLIYGNSPEDITLSSIIETNSSFVKSKNYKTFPVFEMQCNQDFPMEQTIVPIMKRKVIAYIFQILNISKIKNFDSE
jgi:hypothetical protein